MIVNLIHTTQPHLFAHKSVKTRIYSRVKVSTSVLTAKAKSKIQSVSLISGQSKALMSEVKI